MRISHSGDGCGDTWPLCHGQLIPAAERGKTWVEYGHRLMSGLYGLLVIYFYGVSRKLYSKKDATRVAAFWVLIFTISEALLGAKLVLFKLVGSNDTPYRAFVMGLHQLNSMLLSGSVALAYLAAQKAEMPFAPVHAIPKKSLVWLPSIFLLIAITGAMAALAATLFPTMSLWDGFLADFSGDSHFLIRIRGFHPLLAILIGGGISWALWMQSQRTEQPEIQKAASQTAFVFLVGIAFGASTLLALSPVWMKITHLALAHVIWFFLLRYVWVMRHSRKA